MKNKFQYGERMKKSIPNILLACCMLSKAYSIDASTRDFGEKQEDVRERGDDNRIELPGTEIDVDEKTYYKETK